MIRATKDSLKEGGFRWEEVFKIEWNCKHSQLQGDLFKKGAVCLGCGRLVVEGWGTGSNIEHEPPSLLELKVGEE